MHTYIYKGDEGAGYVREKEERDQLAAAEQERAAAEVSNIYIHIYIYVS